MLGDQLNFDLAACHTSSPRTWPSRSYQPNKSIFVYGIGTKTGYWLLFEKCLPGTTRGTLVRQNYLVMSRHCRPKMTGNSEESIAPAKLTPCAMLHMCVHVWTSKLVSAKLGRLQRGQWSRPASSVVRSRLPASCGFL